MCHRDAVLHTEMVVKGRGRFFERITVRINKRKRNLTFGGASLNEKLVAGVGEADPLDDRRAIR